LGAGGEGVGTITWRIGSRNANSTFNGIINDVQFKNSGAKASIIKTGSGVWTLANANTYSGNTLVEGGMLLVNNTSGSGTGTGQVTVKNAATLSGKGYIGGPVIVMEGGAISVNKSEIGIFTINNDITFLPGSYYCIDLDPVEKTSDKLIVTGKMKLGGILYLINSSPGSYSAGDSFRIFEATACSGTFELIAPLKPGTGLLWDTTGLSSTGIIRVIESPVYVEEEFQNGGVTLYPNPSSQKVYIYFGDEVFSSNSKNISLRWYNELGKLCYNQLMPISKNGSSVEYNVSKMDPGMYVVVITIDGRSYTRKFVKK
jgi:autotransporter-associated beta strand protein